MPRTIVYVFAGRQPNIEIALPFYRRILDQHPDVEIDVWDLARDPADSRYIRSLPTIDRMRIRTEYYQGNGKASRGQTHVWRHYTGREYQGAVFVKADDDVLFLDTNQFGQFTQAASNNPDAVVSALTINNGASTHLLPDLWDMYQTLGIPLLDCHLSTEYCERSHRWFLDNWQTLTRNPSCTLVPAESWVSINAITYTWQVGQHIAALLGTRPPEQIMDRHYPHHINGRPTRYKVGDEGAVNMQPVLIHTGFVASHLHFGPQIRAMDPALLAVIRKGYVDVARQYLGESA